MRALRPLTHLLLPLALVACGSTVQVQSTREVDGLRNGQGTDGAPPADASGDGRGVTDGPGTGAPAPGTGRPSAASGGSRGSALPGGGAGSGRQGAVNAAGALGRGVTATTVTLGTFYFAGSEEGLKQAGINYDAGDPAAQAKAAVAGINRAGGIAGRRVKLEVYAYPQNTTDPFDAQYQQICEHFVNDTQVFAVAPADHPVLKACLAKAGIVTVGSSLVGLPEQEYAKDPSYADLVAFTPEGAMRNLVDSLSRTDYLSARWNTLTGRPGGTADVKLGILRSDDRRWDRAVNKVLIPELAKKGVVVTADQVFTYHVNESASEFGSTVSSIQSAVLKFNQSRVTHVIPIEAAGFGFFAQGANSQTYYPRYGVTSLSAVQTGVDAGLVPTSQLNGAVGLGWTPVIDTHAPSPRIPAGERACTALMRGEQVDMSTSASMGAAMANCDLVFFFKRVLEGIPRGQSWNRVTFGDAVGRVGTFAAAGLPLSTYRPDKHYPITLGWPMAWDSAGCGCMKYTGRELTMR